MNAIEAINAIEAVFTKEAQIAELKTALQFAARQIEALAHHAFSDNQAAVKWLEKCDAYQNAWRILKERKES